MDKKFEDVSKNVIYTAVGVVVVAAEKAQVLLEECRVKGQEACEKYAIKNEELKRHAKEAFKNVVNVTVVKDEEENNEEQQATETNNETEDILSQIDKLSKEDLARVKEKLSKLENDNTKVNTTEVEETLEK